MLEILIGDICIVKPFRDYETAKKWLRELKASRDQTSGTGPRETHHNLAGKLLGLAVSES